MSSYKQTFQQVRSSLDLDRASKLGQVTRVNSNSGNLELEGTVNIVYSDGSNQTNVFPRHYGFQQLPTIGELVEISKDDFEGRYYYAPPINVHNFPTHNSPNESVVTTSKFIEPSTVNPYKIHTGDTILQGRFGQSLRFTQSIPQNNSPWSQGTQQGSSVILLSSGQAPTLDGLDLLEEDLDQDPAILVLQENGKLTYEGTDEYEGDQAYLASNRVVIKARQDVINLSTENGNITLSPESLAIEAATTDIVADTLTTTGTNVNLNYDRVNLGENSTEPVIQSTEFLTDLASLNAQLVALSTALTGVVAVLAVLPGGQAPAAVLQTASTTLITQANTIQTKIASGNYLSSTVFSK